MAREVDLTEEMIDVGMEEAVLQDIFSNDASWDETYSNRSKLTAILQIVIDEVNKELA